MPRWIVLGAIAATLAALLYLHFASAESSLPSGADTPSSAAPRASRPASLPPSASLTSTPAEASPEQAPSTDEEAVADTPGTLSLRGRVTDPAGQPLAGVVVQAFPPSDSEAETQSRARTDIQGRFRLRTLVPGLYVLRFDRELFLSQFVQYELTKSPGPLAITLQPAPAIQGKAVDAAGNPLGGVEVGLYPSRHPPTPANAAPGELTIEALGEDPPVAQSSTKTRPDGSFILDTPEPGPWLVRTQHEGFIAVELETSSPSKDVWLVLGAGASVEVSVVDEHDQPVPHASVGLWQEPGEPVLALQATADSQGHTVLHGLAPGQYQLVATPPQEQGFRMVTAPLSVRSEQPQRVQLKFEPGQHLSGIVVDSAGRPVAEADVVLRFFETSAIKADKPLASVRARLSTQQLRAPLATRTGSDGHFMVQHLRMVDYQVSVKKPGYTLANPSGLNESLVGNVPIASPAQGELRIVLDYKGRVSGRVVRASDGEPLTSFEIDGKSYTSPDGTFTVTSGEPGSHVLDILAPGVGGLRQKYTALAGQDVALGDIVLGDGRPLRVRVEDSVTGQPLVRVHLSLMDKALLPGASTESPAQLSPQQFQLFEEPEEEPAATAHLPLSRVELGLGGLPTTDGGGYCQLPDVPSRPLVLTAVHDGYEVGEVAVGATERELTVRLRAWATLQGHVSAGGQPIAQGQVSVYTTTAIFVTRLQVKQGWYSGHRVAPGHYLLRADCIDCPSPKPVFLGQEVTVPGPLEVLSVDFQDSSGATLEVHTPEELQRLVLVLVRGQHPALTHPTQLRLLNPLRHPGERLKEESGYLFRSVPAGHYTLLGYYVQLDETYAFLRDEVDVPAEGELELQLTPK
jgi:hypothetical protein